MQSLAPADDTAANCGFSRGPSRCAQKIFERRGKRPLSPIRLDCIKPFTSSSDKLCILSAPATHVRLQTVQGGDGFVLHKCIDIRTLEFFLHPQSICNFEKQTSTLLSDKILPNHEANEFKSVIDQTSDGPCAQTDQELQLIPKDESSHSRIPAYTKRSVSPANKHTPRSPRTSPPSSSSEVYKSDESIYSAGSDSGNSMAAEPGCCSNRPTGARNAKRRSASPGTPCNVESVAWFVGAGLTGATIRLRRRLRREEPALPADSSALTAAARGERLLAPPLPPAPPPLASLVLVP